MLYIKFEINNLSKYTDFQKLFGHMQETRQAGYDADEFEEEETEYDWENMTDDEYQKFLEEPTVTPEMERYQKFIPDYANDFLESYVSFDKNRAGDF